MATTGIITADLIRVSVAGTAIGCVTSASLKLSVETKDIVCQDTNRWAVAKAGKRSWTIDGGSYYRLDGADKKFTDIFALYLSGAEVEISFYSSGTGDKSYTGDAIVTSAEVNAQGDSDPVTWSVSFLGIGELVEGTTA